MNLCILARAQSSSFVSSAFISPASPTIPGTNQQQHRGRATATTAAQSREILPGNIINGIAPRHGTHGIPLFAKKKKKSTNEGKGGKIQVKLTKDVAGTGVNGDVIRVAPAFFENSLKRTQSAVRISDDEVAKENAERSENNKVKNDTAMATKDLIEGIEMSLSKKTGPDGRLFGGITHKLIMEELGKLLPEGSLGCKQVKINAIKLADEDGTVIKKDIKQIGEYRVTVKLLENVFAELGVNVIAD